MNLTPKQLDELYTLTAKLTEWAAGHWRPEQGTIPDSEKVFTALTLDMGFYDPQFQKNETFRHATIARRAEGVARLVGLPDEHREKVLSFLMRKVWPPETMNAAADSPLRLVVGRSA